MHKVYLFVLFSRLPKIIVLAPFRIVRYPLLMSKTHNLNILFLGDIIGKPGRRVVKAFLEQYRRQYNVIIANVENVAHGSGIAETNLVELKEAGVQIFTGGNHTFDRKEIFDFIDREEKLVRPANYPEGTPGIGYRLFKIDQTTTCLGVLNIMGRVFMEPLASPFIVADQIVAELAKHTKLIFVDFHAEATAEKVAMGWHLDGRVSAVIGTHTHVQTADERILPQGTAYITDAGCCGPRDGIIGMDKATVYRRLIKQLPTRLEVAPGPARLCGISLSLDSSTGKAVSIERVQYIEAEDSVIAGDLKDDQ